MRQEMASKKNKNNKSKQKVSFLQRVDNFATKHWFATSVFIVGSSWWFSVVIAFWGEYLHLIHIDENNNKSFTLFGFILTSLIFAVIVINTALSKYKRDLPNETQTKINKMTASFNLLDKLLSNISQICVNKLSTQIKKIESIKKYNEEPPIVYSNPCIQFETMLREIVDCLSFVLSTSEHRVKPDSLYASIAYNFPKEDINVWKWVDVQKQQGLDIDSLLKEKTTFSSLLNDPNKSYEFFNSKQFALEQHKYVPDDCDKYDVDGNLSGSIACFELSIKRNDITYIRAILSIATYDIRFVEVDNIRDENQESIINTRENIRKIVVSEFSKRMRIELCNYYIQFLRSKWEEQQQTNP